MRRLGSASCKNRLLVGMGGRCVHCCGMSTLALNMLMNAKTSYIYTYNNMNHLIIPSLVLNTRQVIHMTYLQQLINTPRNCSRTPHTNKHNTAPDFCHRSRVIRAHVQTFCLRAADTRKKKVLHYPGVIRVSAVTPAT